MDIFLIEIEKRLKLLPNDNKVLFSALTCEKLLLNYNYFSSLENWGDKSILDDPMVLYYEFIKNNIIDEIELERISRLIEDIAPDTEDFNSPLVSYALDACCAFEDTINFLKTFDYHYVLNVSSYARDTVDMFIQEIENLDPNDIFLDKKIHQNKYYQNEFNRQKNILNYLSNITEITPNVITELRSINSEYGNIIDLSIL